MISICSVSAHIALNFIEVAIQNLLFLCYTALRLLEKNWLHRSRYFIFINNLLSLNLSCQHSLFSLGNVADNDRYRSLYLI